MKSWDDQNNAPVYSVDALKEQHMDVLLRLAFMRIEQERADLLQALVDENKAGISIEAMDEIYSKSKPKIAQMIEKETGKSRRKRFVRRTLPRITRIAAAILLTIYMGATVTFATVRSVRVYVLKFLINMEEQYAELSLIKDEGAVLDVPIDWKGSWYPSYIPEDFPLSSVGKDGYKLFFTAQDGRMITFTEYDIILQCRWTLKIPNCNTFRYTDQWHSWPQKRA